MRGEQACTIAALRPGMESAFSELLRIYTESIPMPERKSEAALRAMLDRPDYTFLLACAGSAVAGFAMVARVCRDAALLEYLAVAPDLRGRGIGARLFRESAAAAVRGSRTLLMEVESPQAGQAQQLRRIAFYRRQGAREIAGLEYRMPRVSTDEPPPMRLCLIGEELPPEVDRARVHRWLASIYASVYGCPDGDAQIGSMLANLPASIALI